MTVLAIDDPKSASNEILPIAKLGDKINERHHVYEAKIKEALIVAKDAGLLLIAVKQQLPHGEFGLFIQRHLEFSQRTAQFYIQLAENWEVIAANAQHVAHLTLREALKIIRKPHDELVPQKSAISRRTFLELLESVKPGIEPKAFIEQSDCFVFRDDHIHTSRGDFQCSAPCPLPFTGALKAKKLLDVLRCAELEKLFFHGGVEQLRFHRDGYEANLQMEEDVILPVLPLNEIAEWKKLPPKFEAALDAVHACASSNESCATLVNIHIDPKYLEATDRGQVGRYDLLTGFDKRILLRADRLRHILDRKMTQFSISETKEDKWILFKNEQGLIYQIQARKESYVDLDKFLDDSPGIPVTFEENIKTAISRTLPAAKSDPRGPSLKLKLTSDKFAVSADGDVGLSIQTSGRCRYDGETCELIVHPDHFLKLIDVSLECRLTEDALIARQDSFTYSIVVSRSQG